MSCIKRYFEDHIDDFTDEELLEWGYSREDIKLFRESFSMRKEETQA